MRRFRFSLETVLKVKRQIEEQRLAELAQAQTQHDLAANRLAGAKESLQELNAQQASNRTGSLDLAAEVWFQGKHLSVNQEIWKWYHRRLELQAELEVARAKAVEAARERKVLEKLEEKQLQEHQLKSYREEQGFMDELANRAVNSMALPSPSANGL